MQSLVDDFVQKWLTNRRSPIIAGVSGGPDSMALLYSLVASDVPVFVAHVDHLLRENSTKDCNFVRSQAAHLGLAFYSTTIDVNQLAAQKKMTIEEAGREARYQYLFGLAHKLNAQAVMVGHTADDQVETFLLHLLRGSGPDGLRGMSEFLFPNQWSTSVALARPLLAVWREAVIEFCENHRIPYKIDPSNHAPNFLRNRVRHEVLPSLQTINPNIKLTLLKTANLVGDEVEYLNQFIEDAWQKAVYPTQIDQFRIDRKAINSLPIALQRRVWRKTFSDSQGLIDIGYDQVEHAISLSNSNHTSGRHDLGQGYVLYLSNVNAWLVPSRAPIMDPDWVQCSDCRGVRLEPPGEIQLAYGWRIEAFWNTPKEAERAEFIRNSNASMALFQGIEPGEKIIIRCRQPGDRIVPFGMSGHSKKISDFMIDVKIPEAARNRWPLVCFRDRILWVPGYGRSNDYLVNQDAAPILRLILRRAMHEDQAA